MNTTVKKLKVLKLIILTLVAAGILLENIKKNCT